MEVEKEIAQRGMIHIYTGDGKGKTTAALGLVLRAHGHGKKIRVVQFMKNPTMMDDRYGELKAMDKMAGVSVSSFGRAGWITMGKATPEDIKLANDALAAALEALADAANDLVVLDEIFLPLHFGLIKIDDILALMNSKQPATELVLTGRRAPAEAIDRADLVTEMREVKHYFRAGVPARKGVEY